MNTANKMGRKRFYNIFLLAFTGLFSLMYLHTTSQTRKSKSVKSHVHVTSSKSEPGLKSVSKPEQPKWYLGEIYVYRNCNKGEVTGNDFSQIMSKNKADVLAILGGSINRTESGAGKIIHWDGEWYCNTEGHNLSNQFNGSRLALLGLKETPPKNESSPYKILEWARMQNAVTGFVHARYFNDSIGSDLPSCNLLDYSVEAALGTIDFISENCSQNDAVIHSYYKLLNCGFRIGLAAGTDFPCNTDSSGNVLTYVQVKENPLTYEKWIDGIKKGRTVISLNGNNEFLDIKADGTKVPGDEIKVKGQADVNVMVRWTAAKECSGRIELLCNGKVVATQKGSARPGSSVILIATQKFIRSGWLSARRMDEKGHVSHTAPIFVTVNDQPIRASVGDAKYFISRIDHILDNISVNGNNSDPATLKARYEKAREIYIRIQDETLDQLKTMGDGILDNDSQVKAPVKKTVTHKSRYSKKR